jgi:ubiquitin carboxyl-terminal hydrolase L3
MPRSVILIPSLPIHSNLSELSPNDRGKLLETTDLFSAIHASAAAQGQTAAPDINADTDLHFACFVESLSNVPGETGKRLVELDGRRGGPVDHGPSVNFLEASSMRKEI